jgi:peptidoglycan-associated lipoprotein
MEEKQMRKIAYATGVVLCCGMLLVSGCAKKQEVVKEEPVTSTVPTQQPKQPEQAVLSPVQAESVSAQPIKEAPIAQPSETAGGQSQKAAALQAQLDKIYFAFDSSELSEESRNTLARNAGILKQQPSMKVQIEGHCDERGSDEYNLALGERRAKSAMKYLTTLGIPSDRLSTISYGKERPAVPESNEAAWAKNRRGEFIVK